MARFAVERTIQGQGLGRALLREAMLRDAMLRALSSTHELGTRAFVLDAKDDEAIRFYGKLRMMPARTTGTGFTGFSRT